MPLRIVSLLVSMLAAVALVACGEKPPRADPEGRHGFSNQLPQNPSHERTLNQGESERIGN